MKTIEDSIDQGEAYRIICDGRIVGGVVLYVEKDSGFHIVEFYNPFHKCPDEHMSSDDEGDIGLDFRFEKVKYYFFFVKILGFELKCHIFNTSDFNVRIGALTDVM